MPNQTAKSWPFRKRRPCRRGGLWRAGVLLLGCGAALVVAGGCKRGPKAPKSKSVGPMTHLHVQLEGQPAGQWTLITESRAFVGFQEMVTGRISADSDVARRDAAAARLGDLYARFQNGHEERFTLRADGSLVYGHLELLLNETEFEFLKSILAAAEGAPANDHTASANDNGETSHEHGVIP